MRNRRGRYVFGGKAIPLTISGLVTWVRPESLAALVDNDPVATWPDESGAANDLTQGTASKRPIYKVNIQNGRSGVRHRKVNLESLNNTLNLSVSTQAWTIFHASRMPTGANSGRVLGARTNNWLMGFYTSDQMNQAFWHVTWFFQPVQANDGIAAIYAGRRQELGASDTYHFYKNNSVLKTETVGPDSYFGPNGIQTTGYLDDVQERADCDIFEIIAYNRALTDGEMTTIWNYLNGRWAIY